MHIKNQEDINKQCRRYWYCSSDIVIIILWHQELWMIIEINIIEINDSTNQNTLNKNKATNLQINKLSEKNLLSIRQK